MMYSLLRRLKNSAIAHPCPCPILHPESWTLTRIFLACFLAHMLLNHFIHGPSIFSDELMHVEMARSFWAGRYLNLDSVQTFYPCLLYPILISPFFGNFEWETAFAGARVFNALLMALTVFPAYGLAHELTGRRRALAAAALVALLPGMGYSPLIMTENLFLPAFTLAMWMIYRAALQPTAWRRLAAGLICGLGFYVKPHGLLLPVILGLTALVLEADRLRFRPRDGLAGKLLLREYARAVGRHWLTALGWLIAMIPRVLIVALVEHQPLSPQSMLGRYSDDAAGKNLFSLYSFILSLAGYGMIWVWLAGLLPVVVFGRQFLRVLRGGSGDRTRLLVIQTIVTTLLMMIMVARHTTLNNTHWKIHERYLCVVVPLVFILFCAHAEPLGGRRRETWARRLFFALITLGVVLAAHHFPTDLPYSTPSLAGMLLVFMPRQVSLVVIGIYVLLGLTALGLIIATPGGPRRQWGAVALLLVFFNFGWYAMHDQLAAKWKRREFKAAGKISQILGKDDQLLVLIDKMGGDTVWQVSIRNPGIGVHLADENRDWWTSRLNLASDGRILSPYVRKVSWLVASNDWKFNQKPAKSFNDCSLYYIGGNKPLRMDPTQIAAYVTDAFKDAPVDETNYLKNLRLTLIERKLPKSWRRGKPSKVKLLLRNDSAFALPGGSVAVGLGYHWADPERKGTWEAVVWDDGHNVILAPNTQPGEEIEVELEVVGPPTPGDRWVLLINPIQVDRKGRKWSNDFLLNEWVRVRR